MDIIYFPETANSAQPCKTVAGKKSEAIATVGFFDGVHLGHRHVITMLRQMAEERGLVSTVITFERHPRQVLCSDWQPKLLTTLEEKKALIAETGVERLVVLRFDRTMAALTARAFMEQVLLKELDVRVLVTGYDNRFGHNRSEGFDDYVRYGREIGMDVVAGTPLTLSDATTVSSSVVRRLLDSGNASAAARCLGRPYSISGEVVSGQHIGTGMGFPTANLLPKEPLKLIPKAGAYAVEANGHPAMMNIGTRPTFDGQGQTLEVHLLDYEGNLYGQELTVRFLHWLREERRFDSREALVAQLQRDAAKARKLLSITPY